jgi:iron complex outermembrane receptor protein
MRKLLLAGSILGVGVLPLPAFAQDAAASEDDVAGETATQDTADAGLNVITVTAQRREESLQDVAIPVTAITGDELLKRGVTDTSDLSKVVPALQVQPTGGAGFSLYLRGVGSLSGNSFAENAVAFSFNNVYVGRPTSTSGTFYDLERVEVLKGPQGTLYGRNATGGAVNVIPRRPELGELGGDFTLQYGNYNHILATGAINVPLGTNAAIRAAAQVVDRDGYLSDGSSDEKGQAGRLSFLFEPSSTLSVALTADYYNQGGRGPGSVIIPAADGRYAAPPLDDRVGGADPRAQAVPAAVAAGMFAPPFCGGFGGFVTSGCVLVPQNDSFVDGEYWGLSADVEADLGFATLTVIPAYRSSSSDYINYLPGFLLDVTDEAEQWSLETRLASNTGSPLQYVLGAFYFKEEQDAVNFFAQGRLATTLFTPHLETESLAVFGQATHSLTDTFRVIGGIRWTTEDKVQETSLGNGNPFMPDPFNPPLQATFTGELSFEEVTWKAGVEWDAGYDSLVYANVATGFKAGGFYVAAPPDNTFAPETLTAYTIGTKNRFLDNRLQLNVEAFYWDYSDQQITFVGAAQTATGTFASSGVTINAGEAKMYGVEVEALFALTRNDLFSLNVQRLETEYEQFLVPLFSSTPAPPPTACPFVAVRPVPGGTFYDTDCSGRPTLNSPDWSARFGYEHTFEFASGMDLVVGGSTLFESSRYLDITFQPESRQDSYMMSDAFVTLEGQDDKWSLTAFVNNIEDEEVRAQSGNRPILNIVYGALRPPRTYGLRGTVRF